MSLVSEGVAVGKQKGHQVTKRVLPVRPAQRKGFFFRNSRMGVRGDVLRHKKWNVWNPDNLDRVRRDKAKAAEEEQAKEDALGAAAAEHRLELLRKKAADTGSQGDRPEQLSNSVSSSSSSSATLVDPAPHQTASAPRHKQRKLESSHEGKPAYLQHLLQRSKPKANDPAPPSTAPSGGQRPSADLRSSEDLAELFFGPDWTEAPPPVAKQYAEVWRDKTRNEPVTRMVAKPDMSHAVNGGQREPEPWWVTMGHTADDDRAAKRAAQRSCEDPLVAMTALTEQQACGSEDVASRPHPAPSHGPVFPSAVPPRHSTPTTPSHHVNAKRPRSPSPTASTVSSSSSSSSAHRRRKKDHKQKKHKRRSREKEKRRGKRKSREEARLAAEIAEKRRLLEELRRAQ